MHVWEVLQEDETNGNANCLWRREEIASPLSSNASAGGRRMAPREMKQEAAVARRRTSMMQRLRVGKEGGEEEVAAEEKCWILPYVVGDSKFCLLLCAMQT